MSSDRRRSPRIEIVGRLHGHAVSLDLPIQVREMSLGGMSIETPFVLPVGIVHEFAVTLGDGSSVVLAGRVKYSQAATRDNDTFFLSGIEFLDQDASPPPAEDVLNKLT